MGGMNASAQTPKSKPQPYFAPKRVLLLSATQPGKKSFPAPELAAAALQSLRNQFPAPQNRVVTETEVVAALKRAAEGRIAPNTETRPENPVWLADRSPAETTAALIAAGKAANADTVTFVAVREGSSRQVTLAVWHVEVATGRAVAEGRTLTGGDDTTFTTRATPSTCSPNQPTTDPPLTPTPGVHTDPIRADVSPSRDDARYITTQVPSRMDDAAKRLIVARLLTEWSIQLYK
jgi:hypothetical protein